MSEPEQTGERRGGTGMPGCFILCAILVVFGGLVILYAVIGYKQNNAIGEFTVDEPAEIQVVSPTPEEAKSAKDKLIAIKEAATQNKAERILFTKEDLNVLIATLEVAEDFRGTTFVESLEDFGLVVRTAQPLRKGVLSKGHRYLNGSFVFVPEVRKRTIAFKVKDIKPDKGSVPEQFVSVLSSLDLFKLDPENKELEATIASIKRVYTEGGMLVVETQVVTDQE